MSRTSYALGGVVCNTRQETAGAGGVGYNDIVYRDTATNTILPIATTNRKGYGWAQNAADATETVDILPGHPGVYRNMRFADPALYAVTQIGRCFGISGSSGAHRIDLSDTTNTIVKLIRREYDYTLSEYVGVVELVPVKTLDYTIGTEAADVILVTLQVKNPDGSNATGVHALDIILSDDTTGAVSGDVPSGAVAAGASGVVAEALTAKVHLLMYTSVLGAAIVSITESGADTWYLHTNLGGNVFVSGAVTFAA